MHRMGENKCLVFSQRSILPRTSLNGLPCVHSFVLYVWAWINGCGRRMQPVEFRLASDFRDGPTFRFDMLGRSKEKKERWRRQVFKRISVTAPPWQTSQKKTWWPQDETVTSFVDHIGDLDIMKSMDNMKWYVWRKGKRMAKSNPIFSTPITVTDSTKKVDLHTPGQRGSLSLRSSRNTLISTTLPWRRAEARMERIESVFRCESCWLPRGNTFP